MSQKPVWLWSEYMGVGLQQWPAWQPKAQSLQEFREGKEKKEENGAGVMEEGIEKEYGMRSGKSKDE